MTFPKIKSLGLTIFSGDDIFPHVSAKHLETILEKGNVVFGRLCRNDFFADTVSYTQSPDHTHSGLLINIQAIEKKPCVHAPYYVTNNVQLTPGEFKCKHCGTPLVARWEAKGES